jgi:hypothetical protein
MTGVKIVKEVSYLLSRPAHLHLTIKRKNYYKNEKKNRLVCNTTAEARMWGGRLGEGISRKQKRIF